MKTLCQRRTQPPPDFGVCEIHQSLFQKQGITEEHAFCNVAEIASICFFNLLISRSQTQISSTGNSRGRLSFLPQKKSNFLSPSFSVSHIYYDTHNTALCVFLHLSITLVWLLLLHPYGGNTNILSPSIVWEGFSLEKKSKTYLSEPSVPSLPRKREKMSFLPLISLLFLSLSSVITCPSL